MRVRARRNCLWNFYTILSNYFFFFLLPFSSSFFFFLLLLLLLLLTADCTWLSALLAPIDRYMSLLFSMTYGLSHSLFLFTSMMQQGLKGECSAPNWLSLTNNSPPFLCTMWAVSQDMLTSHTVSPLAQHHGQSTTLHSYSCPFNIIFPRLLNTLQV